MDEYTKRRFGLFVNYKYTYYILVVLHRKLVSATIKKGILLFNI